jgi:triacylglycerol lipase
MRPAPRASSGHRRAAGLALAAVGLGAAVLLVVGRDGGTAPPPDPVVFVHGWLGNGDVWAPMVERFEADGYTDDLLHAWSYDSSRANDEIAGALAEEVARVLAATDAAAVDIVAHSMGSLSSRWYLAHLGGDQHVDAWVSLGGPNHGMELVACPNRSCDDMRIGSAFLTRLNDGDETPGDVRYATWWSPCDTVVDPDASVSLEGATNARTGCVGHGELIDDQVIYEQVRDFVR